MPKGKNIKTPAIMWELFNQYKVWAKKNPFKVTDWVGGMAKKVTRSKERPLTLEGFENYLYENQIITDVSDYFENKDQRYSEYIPVCSRIKKVIREDQIAGGMAGIYNPSITQRLNGLTEKTEQKNETILSGKVGVTVVSSGVPLANRETDVDA